jgi:predicted chitinase
VLTRTKAVGAIGVLAVLGALVALTLLRSPSAPPPTTSGPSRTTPVPSSTTMVPAPITQPPAPPPADGIPISEAQFNQMFPKRNPFYTYAALASAAATFPAFAKTGDQTARKREMAAFLANVNHESGGLVYVVEQNKANYPAYCHPALAYGCPAGPAAYYGRGPIQLSHNFNYKAAGDFLGIDLLRDPFRVERDPTVAIMTGLWYWNTQIGPGAMTAHHASVSGRFGETIRAINGAQECGGRNQAQVDNRIQAYERFSAILGVPPGDNLRC